MTDTPAHYTCTRCKETKPMTAFSKDASRPSGVRSRCRSCEAQQYQDYIARPGNRERAADAVKAWHERPGKREQQATAARMRRMTAKMEGLARYGGVCACCGEADVRFLTFDHIDGGGKAHRETSSVARASMGRWLRDNGYPEGFQVLCWNCNSGRQFNGGVCPHQDPDGRIVCAPPEPLPGDDT